MLTSTLTCLSRFATAALVFGATASAQPAVTTLHQFGRHGDGALPTSGALVAGKNGLLYGITSSGGVAPGCIGGCGTIFELAPPASEDGAWTEKVIYTFDGQSCDASLPTGGLALGANGALYGTTTAGGGSACIGGCGTVFELAPSAATGGTWTETTLYSFTGQNGDGWWPGAGLVLGPSGALYGTTVYGGNTTTCFAGCGTVFELAPPAAAGGSWTESILYTFTGQSEDGPLPDAPLAIGKDGSLYGTTDYGGSSNFGTVFELVPPAAAGGAWTKTVIHRFSGSPTDGAFPATGNLLIGADGTLYGTTGFGGADCVAADGCGTVFALSPPSAPGGAWTETVIHSFAGSPGDGTNPAGLTFGKGGQLYGTTHGGGAYGGSGGYGTIFKLTPPSSPSGAWTESVQFNFNDRGGSGGASTRALPWSSARAARCTGRLTRAPIRATARCSSGSRERPLEQRLDALPSFGSHPCTLLRVCAGCIRNSRSSTHWCRKSEPRTPDACRPYWVKHLHNSAPVSGHSSGVPALSRLARKGIAPL